jgi:ABC-type Fe3+ transport system permease subunit
MKNAFQSGLIIGILSGLWLFIMRWAGYTTFNDQVAPIEYVSILIPIIGLYFGVRSYRDKELKGDMGFLEALVQSFKILIVGGVIAVFVGIVYINYVAAESNFRDFSGRIFGALLIGLLSSLAVSLLLMTKPEKVE